MPILLSAGPSQQAMLQNVVYSLPAKLCHITSSVAIEASQNGSTWAALAGANTTGVLCSSGFIRCPTANCTIAIKA